ncbi:MAG: ferredoxin [Pseudomonadota bacterium]
MSLDALEVAARAHSLAVFGLCHTVEGDNIGKGTLALLGPHEPGFWSHFQGTPEFADGAADPMDRWSLRVVTELAKHVGGTPLFPFGSPARPFIGWALRSGRAWSSPAQLLVHDVAGLMVSYRGAVLLPEVLPLPEPSTRPCEECDAKPCLTACPVGALGAAGYDIPACHRFLDQADGKDCMNTGCAVRRSCPVSRHYARQPEQSAFHMASFHKTG